MSCRCEKDYLCIECASRKSAEDALAAAQAQAAEMRLALEGLSEEVEAVALGEFGGDWADQFGPLFEATEAARAALALTPGDALERVRRQTRIETLEALPCVLDDGPGCEHPSDSVFDPPALCARCKALAEARKGGK